MQISNKQHLEAVTKGRTDRFPAFRNQSDVCLRKEDWTYFQHPSNPQSEEQSSIVGAMSEAKSKTEHSGCAGLQDSPFAPIRDESGNLPLPASKQPFNGDRS